MTLHFQSLISTENWVLPLFADGHLGDFGISNSKPPLPVSRYFMPGLWGLRFVAPKSIFRLQVIKIHLPDCLFLELFGSIDIVVNTHVGFGLFVSIFEASGIW